MKTSETGHGIRYALRLGMLALLSVGMGSVWSCFRSDSRRAEVAPVPTLSPYADALVKIDALPHYYLVASAYDVGLPSRLLVLRVRAWTWGDEVFAFSPTAVTIALPDGTVRKAFDGTRARVLLERLNVSAAREGGEAAGGNGWRSADAASTTAPTREEVRYILLEDGDLNRDEPVYGYVVIDTEQPQTSLEGAVLEVSLVRRSDAAVIQRFYRFGVDPTPAPAQ